MAEPKSKIPPKQKIAATAFRLFDAQGVHLTGINQIIDESDVAKKTFYHHYPSKDDLIVDYFVEKDRIWFGRLEEHVNAPGRSPQERLLGIFDYLEEWFSEADYCGCAFIRALSEFRSEDTPKSIRECINRHYTQTRDLVEGLLKEARPEDHARLLPTFLSLISGSAIVAQADGSGKVAVINKGIAEKLLAQA
jgi:AcrR family transcriptional regulator